MKVSIIVPTYNEEKNISIFYQSLGKVLNNLLNYEFEIIFINDGSEDNTQLELNKLKISDKRIKLIEFTRNFGKEIAVTAGLNYCSGKAVILIDADLQHPIEYIPEFIKKWEQGSELVVGIRKKNKGAGIFKNISSWAYYKIINSITDIKVKPNSTDYRLLDRTVVDEFNRLTERNRMVRGLITWLGFRQSYVYFEADQRAGGKAGYSTLKLFKLAITSIISMSLFPLKFAGYLGVSITLISGSAGLFAFIEKYILKDPWNLNFSAPPA